MEKKKITEAMVKKAVARFLKEGGIVVQLPTQPTPLNFHIGWKYGVYESLVETGLEMFAV